jgi:hypothetical protein
MLPDIELRDEKESENPLKITMPDGEALHSTHEGYLPLDNLPDKATFAHKVPGLAHSSLLSIKQLCDHGCYAVFTKKDCQIFYKGKLILVGHRHPATGLWIVPLRTKKTALPPPKPTFPFHAAHNAYQASSNKPNLSNSSTNAHSACPHLLGFAPSITSNSPRGQASLRMLSKISP